MAEAHIAFARDGLGDRRRKKGYNGPKKPIEVYSFVLKKKGGEKTKHSRTALLSLTLEIEQRIYQSESLRTPSSMKQNAKARNKKQQIERDRKRKKGRQFAPQGCLTIKLSAGKRIVVSGFLGTPTEEKPGEIKKEKTGIWEEKAILHLEDGLQ